MKSLKESYEKIVRDQYDMYTKLSRKYDKLESKFIIYILVTSFLLFACGLYIIFS